MSEVFKYGGYHFIPYRQFRKGEIDRPAPNDSRPWKNDMQYAMRNMRSDGLNLTSKNGYNYDGFYAASTDKGCDIFRCVETGRLYVPGANELFGFKETLNRERNDAR